MPPSQPEGLERHRIFQPRVCILNTIQNLELSPNGLSTNSLLPPLKKKRACMLPRDYRSCACRRCRRSRRSGERVGSGRRFRGRRRLPHLIRIHEVVHRHLFRSPCIAILQTLPWTPQGFQDDRGKLFISMHNVEIYSHNSTLGRWGGFHKEKSQKSRFTLLSCSLLHRMSFRILLLHHVPLITLLLLVTWL